MYVRDFQYCVCAVSFAHNAISKCFWMKFTGAHTLTRNEHASSQWLNIMYRKPCVSEWVAANCAIWMVRNDDEVCSSKYDSLAASEREEKNNDNNATVGSLRTSCLSSRGCKNHRKICSAAHSGSNFFSIANDEKFTARVRTRVREEGSNELFYYCRFFGPLSPNLNIRQIARALALTLAGPIVARKSKLHCIDDAPRTRLLICVHILSFDLRAHSLIWWRVWKRIAALAKSHVIAQFKWNVYRIAQASSTVAISTCTRTLRSARSASPSADDVEWQSNTQVALSFAIRVDHISGRARMLQFCR